MFLSNAQMNPPLVTPMITDALDPAIIAIISLPSVATQLMHLNLCWKINTGSNEPSNPVAAALQSCTNLRSLKIINASNQLDAFSALADALGGLGRRHGPAWPVLRVLSLIRGDLGLAAPPSRLQSIFSQAPAIGKLNTNMEFADVEQAVRRSTIPAAALESLVGGWAHLEALIALCDRGSHKNCMTRQVKHIHVIRKACMTVDYEHEAYMRILRELKQSSSDCPSLANIKSFEINTSPKASKMGILLQSMVGLRSLSISCDYMSCLELVDDAAHGLKELTISGSEDGPLVDADGIRVLLELLQQNDRQSPRRRLATLRKVSFTLVFRSWSPNSTVEAELRRSWILIRALCQQRRTLTSST
ncbi:hypothetical protein BKA62DRAFT_717689 [Auriculariales sp. MPI-PUGE-AT-0066]|nr:hypothetical protein BKA62DRAFT_717689 [Auriculariales sp. MPI-PUGE-AT-0066]